MIIRRKIDYSRGKFGATWHYVRRSDEIPSPSAKDLRQKPGRNCRRSVKHTVSGLLKLLYPNEEYTKDAVRRCLEYALEARRRVKEQLKKIGGMEFYDVHFSYIDPETMEEKFISVPEQGGGMLIPDGPLSPGVMHTVA
ncbi:MAG TPA: BREX system Lon protease-like protein BrxL, partial [Isosphaeraceae bacterium]|nr:BREX system Lon protease-like protein BrxL [Isosphaeraceae bacterium]